MRTDQLQYLIEIGKHRSLNSASKALHLTPQALSMSIKQLEGELGFPVLYRSAVGAQLTPKGRATALSALQFLRTLESIRESDCAPAAAVPEAQRITLAMPPGSAESYIPSFQAMLYKAQPKWRLDIVEASYQNIIADVLAERAEIAVTAQLSVDGVDALNDLPPELEFVPFLHYRCYCYGGSQFPISRCKTITLKAMLAYPIVLYEPAQYIYGRIIEGACPVVPAQIIWVARSTMISEFVRNNICLTLALVNEHDHKLLMEMPEGLMIALKENIVVHYGYLVKRQKKLSKAAASLAEYLLIFYHP